MSADPDVVRAVEPQPHRTLVVVGDLPEPGQFERAVAWAVAHGWPVVAEPFGAHPRPEVVPHGPLLLDGEWLDRHGPERVVTVGRLTLSRPVAALLRRPGTVLEAVSTHQWIRSRSGVARVHPVAVLDHHPATPPDDRTWADEWRAAGAVLAAAVRRAPAGWPSGRAVATTLLQQVPDGSVLFVGSSSSARDVDVAQGPTTARLDVVANRGLAGIDGCVSTAVGLALAQRGVPTYALMGDLTFLHDANGLLVGPHEPRPDLTVVVVNDDGGGIFALLEPGEPARADDFERVFGTPTGTDLSALCAAHGVPHEVAHDEDSLVRAVSRRPEGLRVVEVRLDRSAHRAAHTALREAVTAALR